jgi:ubiquinone/menaquinone biosynthesis C-methylase UbiE
LDRSAIFLVLQLVVVTAAAVYVGRQVKRPTRFVGRLFAWMMNHSHSALTDWALTHLKVDKAATVLDVGCGGGRTIEKLAEMATLVYGIDNAAGSVAASRAHNKRLIAEGRVLLEHASVSRLPFSDDFFELVTAVETQYYWPDVVNDMREILRVLKPGGRLIVVAESYKGGRHDWLLGPIMRLIGSHRLSADDHRALFQSAGYTEVELFEELGKGWLCATGRKPLVLPP